MWLKRKPIVTSDLTGEVPVVNLLTNLTGKPKQTDAISQAFSESVASGASGILINANKVSWTTSLGLDGLLKLVSNAGRDGIRVGIVVNSRFYDWLIAHVPCGLSHVNVFFKSREEALQYVTQESPPAL
jgi:hypothetical protein